MEVRNRLLRAIARLPEVGSRHARTVVIVFLAVTLLMGYGMTTIQFEDKMVDLLPRGNPHTEAAKNVTERFPQNYYVTSIYLVIDPSKWDEANERLPNRVTEERPDNVTDEVYMRGQNEFIRFFLENVETARYNITLESYVRTINYTNTGRCVQAEAPYCADEPDPSAYSMPGRDPEGERRYAEAWQTVWQLSRQTVRSQVNTLSWNTTRTTFLFQPGPGDTTKDVGHQVMQGWREYRQWAPENARWDVFDLEASMFGTNQPTILDAHTSDVTREDVSTLAPLVALFIVVALYLAFRDAKSIGATGLTLFIGAVWSFGAMGYLGIPLNTINLALVPLILGNGIDYSIHVTNEFLEHRGGGMSDVEAFREAGMGAGVPLFIATCTTVGGLLVMAASPSLLMAQVGLVSAVAMVSIFLLATVFLPATLTLAGTDDLDKVFRPSDKVARWARGVSRRHVLVAGAVLAITAATLYTGSTIRTESYGNPALNFPEGDPIREDYERQNLYFHGTEDPEENWAVDWFVFEGDIMDPEFHDYLWALEENVSASEYVRAPSVVDIRFIIEQWQGARAGTTGAVTPYVREEYVQRGSTYPDSRDEIRRNIEQIFSSPIATYASLFWDHPENDITIMLMETRQGDRFEQTERIWNRLWAIEEEVAREEGRPDDVQTHMYGFTPTSYLFVEEQLPWLQYMALTGFAIVTGLVYFFTRSWRPTATVATLMGLTSIWWVGILPAFDIGLSITLLLPLVFIMSIGSDYAVHLTWNLEREEEDPSRVFETTGKAVFYSGITDGGAFLIFAGMRYLMVGRAMLATSLAIFAILVCTLLIVPLLYRKELRVREPSPDEAPSMAAGERAVEG